MKLLRLLQLVTIACAALFALPAHAVDYCVNSVSGLNAAFASANSAAEGTSHYIRVRPGTYAVPNGLTFEPAGDKDNKAFSLTGGWNSDCSARTINASATVLDANAAGADGDFYFHGDNASYTIEGIRFINFVEFHVSEDFCGGFFCPGTQFIRVRYNELRQGNFFQIFSADADALTVTNNLFANLSSDAYPVSLFYFGSGESPLIFAFNTLANLSCGEGKPALLFNSEASGTTLHHNVLQSSCSADIEIFSDADSQPVALRNNLYATRTGLAPTVSAGNVITSNPGFVNATGGDYHLKEIAPVSPAINTGMTLIGAAQLGLAASIPSQDLDGPAGARLIGNQYDMGAYESSINNASVLTVINTNDAGAGSLRAAITAANASPGLQKIEFNIPGSCTLTPFLILLQSPLPDITDSVEIDGYSQPQAAANTLEVGTDAVLCVGVLSQSLTLAQALQVPSAVSASTSLTLKGIAFAGTTGFNGNFTVALRLRGGSNHVIQGNAFSGVGPGTVGSLGTLGFGLQINGSAQNVLIGGAAPDLRNSFGSMTGSAIVLNDATSGGHTIQNNYIGLSADGATASSIGQNGIFASASPDIKILGNVIASVGTSAAIAITGAAATGYTIDGNKFGVNAFGIPNAAMRNETGIRVSGGSGSHVIGSLNPDSSTSNLITNSNNAGVWIDTTAGSGTTVRSNKIFDNGVDGAGLGVDIGVLGPSVNDSMDADTGANNGQNWPKVINSYSYPDGSRLVIVSLDSTPNTNFEFEIYRSPDCPGGNRGGNMLNLIRSVMFETGANGIFGLTVNGDGAPGYLVAQATNVSTGDSSEPGPCFHEAPATTTSITSAVPNASQIGQSYLVTALVTSSSGTPTGSLHIGDGNGNNCNVPNLNNNGSGSCTLVSTSVGNTSLAATYSGDSSHAPSFALVVTHAVNAAITTTAIVSDTPDPSELGEPYTVSVQVSTQAGNSATPSGQVAVSDGSGQSCQIPSLSNGAGSCQLTSITAGNKALTASYAGSLIFNASSSGTAHMVSGEDPEALFKNDFE